MPTPDVLGRNGTYIVFRKLHTRVAAYRQYLHAKAASREEEALLGAKMVGRWQSGAPLALAPEQDDPELGADPKRNNDYLYEDDLRGFKCPAGAHARRANPRDALDGEGSVNVRLHRMIRRGTSYGPMLPDGVLEDDGEDRGIVFVFAGAHLKRQFEFVEDAVAQRRHLHRSPRREGSARRAERRIEQLHDPRAPDSPPTAGTAAIRRHPRRRIPLRAGAARPALARRADDVTKGGDVTTTEPSTDRWKDFAPPPTGGEEPEQPVLVDYLADGRVALITLNRPHADNAITTEMGTRLTECSRPSRSSTSVRVAVITGAGDTRLLGRQRPAPAQEHDARRSGCGSARTSTARCTRCASCASPSSPPSTASPTEAAPRSRRAPTSSSPPTTRSSASPRR